MRRHFALLVGIAVLVLPGNFSQAHKDKDKDKDKDKEQPTPNYYPLDMDNTWTFKITVNGNSQTMVSRITKVEAGGATLEASLNGVKAATELLRQSKEGVVRIRNMDQDINPPLTLLKYPIKKDDKWEGDLTVGAEKGKYSCETKEEKVTVAAGEYMALRVKIKLESMGNTVNTTYWFAPDVGIVKQTVDAGPLNMVMELQKFEKGKAKDGKEEKK
jgi:hypothetical protein